MILAVLALMAAGPVVAVTGGQVSGTEENGATVFRGIPYAASPAGDNRWRSPQPVVPWQGVRADNPDAPPCIQNDQGWNHGDYLRGAENCLTLDVATPALTGKRPVMVWIHGGSNRAGSARGTVASTLARKGVVLVAVQYRLGIFGFLPHRGAAAEASGHAGNYGLMDQVAALQWVHDNIAKFGGDPENVTIFGGSAGSQDSSLLLAAPAAKGLFAKAILQSGTPGFGNRPRTIEEGFALGDQADKLIEGDGSIAALRRASVPALLAADLKLHEDALDSDSYMWLRPTIDGAVLPDSPRALLEKAPPRPVIVGSNRAEFGPTKGEIDWNAALARHFGPNADKARAFYRIGDAARTDDPRLGSAELEFSTDWIFRCPAGRTARLLANQGAPVWRYEFDIGKDGGLTSHGAELPYVLGDASFAGLSLQRYWLNFAQAGTPNGTGLPLWPRFEPATRRHVTFDKRGAVPGAKLREPICSMLEEL